VECFCTNARNSINRPQQCSPREAQPVWRCPVLQGPLELGQQALAQGKKNPPSQTSKPPNSPNLQTRQNRHQLITIRLQYSSLANPRAIGVNVVGGKIELVTKQGQNFNKPSKSYTKTTFKATTPSRKLTNNVVSGTTKKGYRTDLHMETIQRVSAVKKSLRQVKANVQPTKLRGSKARKAAAEKQ
jgi:hypothetical protein